MKKVLVYTKGEIPGRFYFVNLEGKEDVLLVSPKNRYSLEVREVLRADPQVAFFVEDLQAKSLVPKKKKDE